MLNDEHVMGQVANGDIQQLSLLFERHHVKLYNFFYKMNHNQTLSEDMTQNVFERLIKYKSSYNTEIPFLPWVYRIARNVNTDYFRKKKIKIDQGIEPEQLEVAASEKPETDGRTTLVKQALKKISEDYREVLILTRYQGLKYSEVANTLQLSEANVKTRVHRAIKALRREYLKLETN